MKYLYITHVVLAFVLLAAHFLRESSMVVMALCLLVPLLMLLRRRWVARLMQAALLAGAVEWLVTLGHLMELRRAAGEPWMRMAAILGVVALFTALGALTFQSSPMRQRFGLSAPEKE